MKTLQTSKGRKGRAVIGLILALVLVVSTFFALESGSSRLTAAAVVESETHQKRAARAALDRVAAAHQDSVTAANRDAARRAAQTVVENRMTEDAREAARSVRRLGTGEASYYGPGFAGRPTANGERFKPSEMTAAHRTLPFGTKLRVTNTGNGKSVVVRVNDRGPYAHNRVIDLSQGAAQRIGMLHSGTAQVRLEVIS